MSKGSGNTRASSPSSSIIRTEAALGRQENFVYNETVADAASSAISKLFDDITTLGHPTNASPIELGSLSEDTVNAIQNVAGITLQSNEVYTSTKALLHHRGGQKAARGKEVPTQDLIEMPRKLSKMDIYTDGKAVIFTDYSNKFIMRPNVEIKLEGNKKVVTNHISSSRVIDKNEFNNGYRKIK